MTRFQIRRQRKAMGLTADKYAERLGLRGKHRGLLVYGWESGRKKPGTQTIFLMKQLRQFNR
jgi:DNA-binding transcriptional regulator YiaG